MSTRVQAWWRDHSGAAAAEMVLVLPFLTVVFFGIIEFGRLFHDYDVVVKGVRDAARYMGRQEANACAGGTWSPVSGTAEAETENMATRGQPSGGTLRLGYFANADVAVTYPCLVNGNALTGVYEGLGDIPIAVVTATVTYTFMFGDYLLPGVPSLPLVVVHTQPNVGE
jgi:Flp pilus assembly protein TadG